VAAAPSCSSPTTFQLWVDFFFFRVKGRHLFSPLGVGALFFPIDAADLLMRARMLLFCFSGPVPLSSFAGVPLWPLGLFLRRLTAFLPDGEKPKLSLSQRPPPFFFRDAGLPVGFFPTAPSCDNLFFWSNSFLILVDRRVPFLFGKCLGGCTSSPFSLFRSRVFSLLFPYGDGASCFLTTTQCPPSLPSGFFLFLLHVGGRRCPLFSFLWAEVRVPFSLNSSGLFPKNSSFLLQERPLSKSYPLSGSKNFDWLPVFGVTLARFSSFLLPLRGRWRRSSMT